MQHLRQDEMIQLAAGEIMPARRAELEQHLNECEICRSLHEQQAAIWNVLGCWTPEAAPPDLLVGIKRKLAEPPAVQPAVWTTASRVSRIAAAIVIGVTVGYAAARAGHSTKSSPPPVASAAVEEKALEALGVEYFEGLSPVGLYAAVQDVTSATGTGGEPS